VRLRALIVALLAVSVLIPVVLVLTQGRASAASMVLSILGGTAEVARGSAAFTRAADGVVLNPGDRVRTAPQSYAVVTFLDGSTMEIEPATTVTVVQATAMSTGAISIQLEQAVGRTWSSVQKLTHPESKFELMTPAMTATVRGTGFTTEVLANGTTTMTVADGVVEVSAQGQTVVVPASSRTTVEPGAPPAAPAPGPIARRLLRFGLHSPAQLVVVDPLGRACGIVPAGPTAVRQIPGCLATDPGIDPQLIDLPDAIAGTYSMVIESIAPGGDFVATASAVDGAGNVSFNYFVSGGGPPETRFGTSLEVGSGADGALSARGLSKLTLVDRGPRHVVVLSTSPRPKMSGAPDASVFAPLPRFGFTAGIEVTPPPSGQTASPGASPSPTVSPAPTEIVAAEPTQAPTVAPAQTAPPVRTIAPPPPPTSAPDPTPTASPVLTLTPSPSPAPTASGPTLSGGFGSPATPMTIRGSGWSSALVTLSWEDGRPLVQATADGAGDFAVLVTVPFDTNLGATYRITASDGSRTASAQIGVYAPVLAVSCSSTAAPVTVTGGGWPPSVRYAVRSSLLVTPLTGTAAADGTFSVSFTPPPGALPGNYPISASAASLLAEPQTCVLQ
jgi:hypothetical protein